MVVFPPVIDISLVCGRRPELLERTLESFSKNVFSNFEIANVFANIDPFCGTEEDGLSVEKLLKKYFQNCNIFKPNSPSFGAAVKRVWSATKSDIVLHMEDDWVAEESIDWLNFDKELTGNVACLSFMTLEKNWRKNSSFHTRYIKRKLFGVTYWRSTVACFTTSPCFLRGDFARRCGELMDPSLDPEKQFSNGLNLDLEKYALKFSNKFLIGRESKYIIRDIGREYRFRSGLNKTIVDGVSVWTLNK